MQDDTPFKRQTLLQNRNKICPTKILVDAAAQLNLCSIGRVFVYGRKKRYRNGTKRYGNGTERYGNGKNVLPFSSKRLPVFTVFL